VIDLGTDRGPAAIERVTLSTDEMDLLLDRLEIDELPVVLDQFPRFDDVTARNAAFDSAETTLTGRGLIEDGEVHRGLAERLQILRRPHWVVALRLFVGDTVSRLCLAKGDDTVVLALRGPESHVIDDAGADLAGILVTALGAADPLVFDGFSAPTQQLGEVFDNVGDAAASMRRLAEIAVPKRDSNVIVSAMLHCYAHTEIVALVYGDGTRQQAENHIAVFDTRDGRFIATASVAADGTKWSALSSGTVPRLRQAFNGLIAGLPDRSAFDPAP